MTFDDQVRAALEHILTGLRGHLEADFRAYTEELLKAAAAERSRVAGQAAEAAAADVRRHAQVQLTQLRDAAKKQTDELRAAAEAQIGELRRTLEELRRTTQQQLEATRSAAEADVAVARQHADAARTKAEAEIEDARRLAQAQVDDVQRAMDARLGTATRERDELRHQLDATRQQLESARQHAEANRQQAEASRHQLDVTRQQIESTRQQADAARQELEATRQQGAVLRQQIEATRAQIEETRRAAAADAEELVIAQLALAHEEHERKLSDALSQARADGRLAEAGRARQLLDAVRALDEAKSLGEVLERLVQFAGREVDRSAVLLVKGERLHDWRMVGFGPAAASIGDLGLQDAGFLAAAVRTGRAAVRAAGDGEPLPPFASGDGGRVAAAVPVTVGGVAVALLYADAPPQGELRESRWPAILELLARHAGRVLEAMTVQQATGLWPAGVARGSQPAGHSSSGSVQ